VDEPNAETHDHARQAAKAVWAKLIRKIYEVDPLVCPKCGVQHRRRYATFGCMGRGVHLLVSFS
jgi:hypothetical protein